MSDIEVGQKFRKVYPFVGWEDENCSGWSGGCRSHFEDGPAVFEGQCIQEEFFSCDDEGFIEYEVLAVVGMPRKYQDRILYRVTMIEPEGDERKSSKCHMVTRAKFEQWIESGYSSYPHDYEVEA